MQQEMNDEEQQVLITEERWMSDERTMNEQTIKERTINEWTIHN